MLLILIFAVAAVFGLTPEEIQQFKPRSPNHIEQNTGLKADYSLTDNGDGSLTFRGNNIPPHSTGAFPDDDGNPNSLEATDFTFKIPNEPKLRKVPLTCIPRGPVGVSTSGIMIFGNFADEKGCPYARDFEELDICDGHPSPFNQYHHHHYAHCIVQPVCGEPSPIVGVAIDGIPIYGPWDESGRQLTQQDLDECGGMTDSSGRYKYIMTVDPPFFMRCLKGEIRADLSENPDRRFVCTCPYDDSMVRSRPPRDRADPNGHRRPDDRNSQDYYKGRRPEGDRNKGDRFGDRRPGDRYKQGSYKDGRPNGDRERGDRNGDRRPGDRYKQGSYKNGRPKGDRNRGDRDMGDRYGGRRPGDRNMQGSYKDGRTKGDRDMGDLYGNRRPGDRYKQGSYKDGRREGDRDMRDYYGDRRPGDRERGYRKRPRPHDDKRPKPYDNRRPKPYDDSGYKPQPYDDEKRNPDDGSDMFSPKPICDFSDKSRVWAACEDTYNKSYNLTREWSRSLETISLAPCCPKGVDCGASCKIGPDKNGKFATKSSCHVETREIYVIKNQPKGWCRNTCTENCTAADNSLPCFDSCYNKCQTGFGNNHV